MNSAEWLHALSEKGVLLSAHGDRLRYRGPREALTPEVLEALKQRKPELLQILRDKAEAAKVYPLTPGQRALWFLYKLAPESAAYNMAFTARIQSAVDVPALRRTFQKLLDRHPSLRAVFSGAAGGPVQSVQAQEISFQAVRAETWNEEQLGSEAASDYQRPFDLERGPLFRVTLFTRSEREHVLLLTAHHIVFDGLSLWTLLGELRLIYPGEVEGNPAVLPEPGCSYADYVRWHAERLQGAAGEKLKTAWLDQLSGDLPALDLPVDRPPNGRPSYRGASQPFKISAERTAQVKELAQREGATLFMTLLAAYHVFLHRLSGQETILVGSATAGRSRPEHKGIVGYFINMIVLRADLGGDPSFRAFLSQVRRTVLAALEHQEYPYPLLVEQLQARRKLGRGSLFQAEFGLQLSQQSGGILDLFVPLEAAAPVDLGGLLMEPFALAQQEGQFDLSMELVDAKGALYGVIKYNTDLFDRRSIADWIDFFQRLLAELIALPDRPLSELSFLAQPEAARVESFEREAALNFD